VPGIRAALHPALRNTLSLGCSCITDNVSELMMDAVCSVGSSSHTGLSGLSQICSAWGRAESPAHRAGWTVTTLATDIFCSQRTSRVCTPLPHVTEHCVYSNYLIFISPKNGNRMKTNNKINNNNNWIQT